MSRYQFEPAKTPGLIGSPSSWREYLTDLANNWSPTSTAVAVLVPWSVVVCFALYYWFFKRPVKAARTALGPFLTFYTLLTDGATAGFDARLMSVFHPLLFRDGNVEKGLLRAMARCLTGTFGPVVRVPRETVALKRDSMQVNCIALVDFERKKQVTCQLSWVRRTASVKSVEAREKQGAVPVGRAFTADEVVDGIGMAPLGTFHVTSFHIEQRGQAGKLRQLDVLKYLRVEEFEYFGGMFVERFFQRRPVAAVAMMHPALQEKHLADKAAALEESIQKVVRSCGGLGSKGRVTNEVDATLTEEKIVQVDTTTSGAATSINGIDMTFRICCVSRDLELEIRFTFVGMRCYVIKYELRILPDEQRQVIVDRDTGETTVVA